MKRESVSMTEQMAPKQNDFGLENKKNREPMRNERRHQQVLPSCTWRMDRARLCTTVLVTVVQIVRTKTNKNTVGPATKARIVNRVCLD